MERDRPALKAMILDRYSWKSVHCGNRTIRDTPQANGYANGHGQCRACRRMGSLLAVENLVKRYGDLTAVDRLSFDVKPGEAFGLLGPNGAWQVDHDDDDLWSAGG